MAKSNLVLLALASVIYDAAAHPQLLPFNLCNDIQRFIPEFPVVPEAAAQFCTSYLRITPSVMTMTQTSLVTAQPTNAGTVTITRVTTVNPPTQTGGNGGQGGNGGKGGKGNGNDGGNGGGSAASTPLRCFQNTAFASPATKAKRSPAPQIGLPDPLNLIKRACQDCNHIDVNPVVTRTMVTTKTVAAIANKPATATVFATVTRDAHLAERSNSLVPQRIETTYIQDNGTYISTNGQSFRQYIGYDFYSYDLYAGFCGNSGATVNTPAGNFACNGFNSCMDVCAKYNAANIQQGNKSPQCKGATYQMSGTYCYLKYAVPGDGAPNCSPRMDYNDNSGLLVKQPSLKQPPA